MPASPADPSPQVVNLLGVERRVQELEGFTVSFETYHRALDTANIFKGQPGDACQSPHWGVVQKGRLTFRYGDHEDVVEAGHAYHARPGHTSLIDAGTEIIQFSPSGPYAAALDVSIQNLAEALSDPDSLSL